MFIKWQHPVNARLPHQDRKLSGSIKMNATCSVGLYFANQTAASVDSKLYTSSVDGRDVKRADDYGKNLALKINK